MPLVIIISIIIAVIIGLVVLVIMLLPWMDRWGCTDAEIASGLPGDDLVPDPPRVTNRAVSINTSREAIFPWLAQMGADKSGLYSYTWLENLVGCQMAKVEEIRPEWQNPKPGDLVKMCAKDPAPPPYEIASVDKQNSLVLCHRDPERVDDSWAFVIQEQPDGSSRLISRTRTTMTGGFWEILRPISFMMERKMLLTIKRLAEHHPN